jgi:hypothetical protein
VKRLVAAVAVLACACAASTRAGTPVERVTVVTDSVGGALAAYPAAAERPGRGFDLHLEVRTCRKLVAIGCWSPIGQPPSALDTIDALGHDLGPVVVVDVGYNDEEPGYGEGVDEVMQALRAAGVERVVWVTLEETTRAWAEMNADIRAAAKRWPDLVVADWARESAGAAWFTDAAHLNELGAFAFARFLRPIVLQALDDVYSQPRLPGAKTFTHLPL